MKGKRRPMGRKQSKRVFKKGTKVHGKNGPQVVMRGGIRL